MFFYYYLFNNKDETNVKINNNKITYNTIKKDNADKKWRISPMDMIFNKDANNNCICF